MVAVLVLLFSLGFVDAQCLDIQETDQSPAESSIQTILHERRHQNGAESLLILMPEVRAAGDEIEVSWFAASNRLYDLLHSAELPTTGGVEYQGVSGWTNIPGEQAGMTYTTSVSQADRLIYRLRVRIP